MDRVRSAPVGRREPIRNGREAKISDASYREKCEPTVFHFAFECSFRDEPGTSK